MNLDESLYRLPLVGWMVRRLYRYFKAHTAVTDAMHVALGLGLGLMIADGGFFALGVIAFAAGVLGHVYAFVKGG